MTPGLAETPELKARFLREAQAAGGLRHQNIVTVYDLGEDHGQPYIAMELIEGQDLEKIIQSRQPMSVEWKIDVLRQVCEGLAYCAPAGIVHRDVKPGNIRVTSEGEVKIMDFGIAHLQSSKMTKNGLVLGPCTTWLPSRWRARRSINARTSSPWARSPTSCSPSGARSTGTA
jgi:serine/threonine-protein kinase